MDIIYEKSSESINLIFSREGVIDSLKELSENKSIIEKLKVFSIQKKQLFSKNPLFAYKFDDYYDGSGGGAADQNQIYFEKMNYLVNFLKQQKDMFLQEQQDY